MIQAAKNPVGEWLIWRLVSSGVRKHFHAVHVRQRAPMASDDPAIPTIVYLNHSGWWDGHLCMILGRLVLQKSSYMLVEEQNLRRYRFFTWAGAFGVDRDDPRAALGSLAYATGLLRADPRAAIFICPQGTIAPNDRRPLKFLRGIAHLARSLDAVRLVPVAARYDFVQEQQPEIFLSVGPALLCAGAAIRPHALTTQLETALTTELDALHGDIVAEQFADFTTVLQGSSGIDRLFDRAMSRGRRESRRLRMEREAREQAASIGLGDGSHQAK